MIAISSWALPTNFVLINKIRELVRPYMLWSGLFQSWDTFAPNPKPVNSYIKAVVITRDRHIKVWSFPRMEELGYGERYRKERYRKFTEVLTDQQNARLLPDVAMHVARMLNDPSDPPDKIILIQYRAEIKPEAEETGINDPSRQPDILYEQYLQPGDLE